MFHDSQLISGFTKTRLCMLSDQFPYLPGRGDSVIKKAVHLRRSSSTTELTRINSPNVTLSPVVRIELLYY